MGRPLLCFSHLRWDHVYQRPNHLMARAARERDVYFIEEPVRVEPGDSPALERSARDGVHVLRARLPGGLSERAALLAQETLLRRFVAEEGLSKPVAWYYTPMALPWSGWLDASATVYDCMDELSAFRGAPPELLTHERALLERADLVFTGGASLHAAKRDRHPRTHLFPSAVDRAHFATARAGLPEPADQAAIPHPRLGYFGVIDERVDLDLLDAVAAARPDWQLVLVGPTAKIDPADLPRRPNVHLLGRRTYEELPAYLAGWNVALLPFARNEATRHISPTKTPEYLAGGRAVVTTPIADVVEPYGRLGLVRVAEDAAGFVDAIEAALRSGPPDLVRIDAFLARISWDRTWREMRELIDGLTAEERPPVGPRRAAARGTGTRTGTPSGERIGAGRHAEP